MDGDLRDMSLENAKTLLPDLMEQMVQEEM